MHFYLFSLLLGFVGLALMAFSGVAGHSGHAHGHSHLHGHDAGDVNVHGIGGHAQAMLGHAAHGGHAHVGHGAHAGPAHAGGHAGHGAQGQAHGHAHGHHEASAARAAGSWFLSFLSPRVLFSILIGVGASGMLLGGLLPEPLLAGAAVAGGFAFELMAVRPVWNFFFRFGSQPALTLESAVTDVATAVTGFNPEGEGLIKIELDGQIVQLLGRLAPMDLASGTRVHAGDTLVVDEVDPVRNRCVVSLPVAAAGQIRGA
jgi:hypothetical protein